MTVSLPIVTCGDCPHMGHNGLLQNRVRYLCHHPTAMANRKGPEGGLARVVVKPDKRPPPWCPLRRDGKA